MKTSPARKCLATMLVAGIAFSALPLQASANAHIHVVNGNAAGVGFNDPTAAAPIGGNPGVTVGQQRLIAFQAAADIWGATLDSAAQIDIYATFEPLNCTASSAVLGSAGPIYVFSDFPGAPVAGTWYHSALVGKLFGSDPVPGIDTLASSDIRARFNANLGNTGCLSGTGWYLGLDSNHGTQIDLVTVLLHEFGHGLGFSAITSSSTGSMLNGIPGAYERFIHDNGTNMDWPAMTNAERVASAISGKLAWSGATVTSELPSVLSLGTPLLRVNAPSSIAGVYAVGAASFGPVLNSPGVTGNMVIATDAAIPVTSPTTTDGCSAINNGGAVSGKIAIIDRGSCGFVVKVKNAQNAGAIAVIIADNQPGSPPAGLGGTDATITIPAVRVTLADGALLKAHVGDSATLGVDMSVYAGADASGHALLYSPSPLQPGSSVSHWNTSAFRNQLMEPAINADLTHSVKAPEDLTLALMRDIGWFPDQDVDGVPDGTDQCADSVLGGTVVIQGCDSGVSNLFFSNGCSIVDVVNQCGASAATHDDFTGCVSHFTNLLKKSLISNQDKASIQRCAGRSSIP